MQDRSRPRRVPISVPTPPSSYDVIRQSSQATMAGQRGFTIVPLSAADWYSRLDCGNASVVLNSSDPSNLRSVTVSLSRRRAVTQYCRRPPGPDPHRASHHDAPVCIARGGCTPRALCFANGEGAAAARTRALGIAEREGGPLPCSNGTHSSHSARNSPRVRGRLLQRRSSEPRASCAPIHVDLGFADG